MALQIVPKISRNAAEGLVKTTRLTCAQTFNKMRSLYASTIPDFKEIGKRK
jgi:hypothetical protein